MAKLSQIQLNKLFVSSLDSKYELVSDISKKPLLIHDKKNDSLVFKVYIYNCTNPPGGRTLDEYKIQLIVPGQKRPERGHLDESDGTTILIVGYAIFDNEDNGAWVIWETDRHIDFAYSANLQVKMGSLIETITKKVFYVVKPGNGETIIVSDKDHLNEAIALRIERDIAKILGD